jgi:PhoPQ-activated pathogenicity-related protein
MNLFSKKIRLRAWFYMLLISIYALSCSKKEKEKIESEPLQQLIDYTKDTTGFSFEVKDTLQFEGAQLYRVKMHSGHWLSEEIVNQTLWWHWVDIVVPDTLDTHTSLLFIGGGSTTENSTFLDRLSIRKAIETKSIVSHVSNIPFQPLRFQSSDSILRYEDNLIAYGWNQFLKGGAKKEEAEWLARFPMTRAVVRAMDVIQKITSEKSHTVTDFFISGASKRGWTTWTTAAVDSRVMGMAPLVIDLLNLVPSFEHHYKLYGEWSPAVKDYVDFEIMEWMHTEEFNRLLGYVEPYQFKERFTMPKLIINGTIDEFFATDSWKFYWNDIPGKKYLRYMPNGNHGLAGTYQNSTVFSFYDRIIHAKPLPEFNWEIENDFFNIVIEEQVPHKINLWSINNPEARDFRIWQVGRNWEKKELDYHENGTYQIKAPSEEGFTASLVEIIFYPDSKNPIQLTTGTHVLPDRYLHPPFEPSLEK